MEAPDVADKIHELSDLELATLLCLIANEHCIITTENDNLNELEQELQLVVSNVFGLSSAAISCTDNTAIDDFTNALLVNDQTSDQSSVLPSGDAVNAGFCMQSQAETSSLESLSQSEASPRNLKNRKIPQVVIVRDLNLADSLVQIQALELIRSRRISIRNTVHHAPKTFLAIVLLSSSGPRLVKHLNDQIFISHYHDPEDGFPNLEDSSDWSGDDRTSTSSVVHKSKLEHPQQSYDNRVISHADLDTLINRSHAVMITAEVKRYLQNIVVFLRLHRAVSGGVSAQATKHFDLLVKCLAPLHSLNYITPSLVALAARKIYPHRLSIARPRQERSMQYGSELAAVTATLEGITPEHVIQEVLTAVEVPL